MKEIHVTLFNVLMQPEKNPDGWLYLPNETWTLRTKGIFADDEGDLSPDYTDDIPKQAKRENWHEVAETQDIESIIENLRYRYPDPTPEQRLKALVYFFENDAFIVAEL